MKASHSGPGVAWRNHQSWNCTPVKPYQKNQGYCQLCSRNHVYLWKSVSHFQSQSFRDMILIMLQHLRVGSSLPNAAQDWNENSFRWVNLQYLECKNCQNVSSLYHNIIYKSSMFVYIIIHIDIYSKYICIYIYTLYIYIQYIASLSVHLNRWIIVALEKKTQAWDKDLSPNGLGIQNMTWIWLATSWQLKIIPAWTAICCKYY